ncbi:hypothetical protein LOC51_08610 [Rubrivivax sp. JA1024]|nr:hypothetical protein [Rubrivivax sp. JA1024]
MSQDRVEQIRTEPEASFGGAREDYVEVFARKLFGIEQQVHALNEWFDRLSQRDRRKHRKEFERRGTALALAYAATWEAFSHRSISEAATHH